MALPKQAQAQIEAAKEIEAAMVSEEASSANKKQAEIDAFIKEVDDEVVPPIVDPPAVEDDPLLLDGEQPPGEAGSTTAKKPRKDYKQMYNVLQGKYDAEVPRMHSDIKALTAQVSKLQESAVVPPVESSSIAPAEYIKPEELEEYGEDLLSVIGRKAEEIVETKYRPLINDLNVEINTLKGIVGNTGQRVDVQEQNQVFAQLDRDVENWRVTNEDPAFKKWLGGVDPFSGRTRQVMMLEAFNNRDVMLVKNFFSSFNKENAAVSTTGAAGQPSGQPTLDLENYVAPTATAGGAQQEGAPQAKRVWAQSEIAKFYSDVQKGHYKKRDKDRMRIDREIGTAVSENRVR